jgi:hypothetical protein
MFGSAKLPASPTTLYPALPYPSHANTKREDLAALFAHLKYSVFDLLGSLADEFVTNCKRSGIRELARDIILGDLRKLSIRLDVAYSHCCWPFRSNISPQLHPSLISCRSPSAAGGPAPLIAAAGSTLNSVALTSLLALRRCQPTTAEFSGDALTFLQDGQRPREARKALSAEFNSDAQRRSD